MILASASPRRRELLTLAGVVFRVVPADIDETPLPDESPAAYVERLAIEKAEAVQTLYPGETILAADTSVVLDGEILGKPVDPADAIRMLTLLSGRTHAVMTGIAVAASGCSIRSHVEITQVTFAPISAADISAYVATGEPLDKAGAYAIQGGAARWVPRIEGDYSNVVGLPLHRVLALLRP